MQTPRLFLAPVPLGKTPANNSLPPDVIHQLHNITVYFVENIQSAVRFLQWIEHPVPDYKISFYLLDKKTPPEDLAEYAGIITKNNTAIISEAGAPGVADPGAKLVRIAHKRGVQVVPLVGPSSVLLAVMASGFNGQQFAFHGYLPINADERKQALVKLEREAVKTGYTQVFMEAPYRNKAMIADAVEVLQSETEFCVAASLTLEKESVQCGPVRLWKEGRFTPPGSGTGYFLNSCRNRSFTNRQAEE